MAVDALRLGRKRPRGTSRVVRGRQLRPGSIVRVLYILLFILFLLVPLYWVAVTSIKPSDDLLANPPVWFPAHPTLLHYTTSLKHMRGWLGLKNSLIIASSVTVLAVLIGSSAAYSMARFRTGGKNLAFWVLSQRFMPPIAVVIPVFLMFRTLGLTDSRIGLILLYTVFALPFTIWMMYAYFRQMPVELEEAALVDGCSRWQALWKVAWPLAAPGIVSAGAFAFIFSWTEFLLSLFLTNSIRTLPVKITTFVTSTGSEWGFISALGTSAVIPSFIFILLVQKQLVRGLTLGSLKE